jgi:hypothetical protein
VAQSDWPTLGQLIESGTRVVLFMDYGAESGGVDYILPEFEVVHIFSFSPRPTYVHLSISIDLGESLRPNEFFVSLFRKPNRGPTINYVAHVFNQSRPQRQYPPNW